MTQLMRFPQQIMEQVLQAPLINKTFLVHSFIQKKVNLLNKIDKNFLGRVMMSKNDKKRLIPVI